MAALLPSNTTTGAGDTLVQQSPASQQPPERELVRKELARRKRVLTKSLAVQDQLLLARRYFTHYGRDMFAGAHSRRRQQQNSEQQWQQQPTLRQRRPAAATATGSDPALAYTHQTGVMTAPRRRMSLAQAQKQAQRLTHQRRKRTRRLPVTRYALQPQDSLERLRAKQKAASTARDITDSADSERQRFSVVPRFTRTTNAMEHSAGTQCAEWTSGITLSVARDAGLERALPGSRIVTAVKYRTPAGQLEKIMPPSFRRSNVSDAPGPGAYNANSSLTGRAVHGACAAFDSQTDKNASNTMLMLQRSHVGPGSYSATALSNPQVRHLWLHTRGWERTENASTQKTNDTNVNVGPGTYCPKVGTIASLAAKLAGRAYTGMAGSNARRFEPVHGGKKGETPGPAFYLHAPEVLERADRFRKQGKVGGTFAVAPRAAGVTRREALVSTVVYNRQRKQQLRKEQLQRRKRRLGGLEKNRHGGALPLPLDETQHEEDDLYAQEDYRDHLHLVEGKGGQVQLSADEGITILHELSIHAASLGIRKMGTSIGGSMNAVSKQHSRSRPSMNARFSESASASSDAKGSPRCPSAGAVKSPAVAIAGAPACVGGALRVTLAENAVAATAANGSGDDGGETKTDELTGPGLGPHANAFTKQDDPPVADMVADNVATSGDAAPVEEVETVDNENASFEAAAIATSSIMKAPRLAAISEAERYRRRFRNLVQRLKPVFMIWVIMHRIRKKRHAAKLLIRWMFYVKRKLKARASGKQSCDQAETITEVNPGSLLARYKLRKAGKAAIIQRTWRLYAQQIQASCELNVLAWRRLENRSKTAAVADAIDGEKTVRSRVAQRSGGDIRSTLEAQAKHILDSYCRTVQRRFAREELAWMRSLPARARRTYGAYKRQIRQARNAGLPVSAVERPRNAPICPVPPPAPPPEVNFTEFNHTRVDESKVSLVLSELLRDMRHAHFRAQRKHVKQLEEYLLHSGMIVRDVEKMRFEMTGKSSWLEKQTKKYLSGHPAPVRHFLVPRSKLLALIETEVRCLFVAKHQWEMFAELQPKDNSPVAEPVLPTGASKDDQGRSSQHSSQKIYIAPSPASSTS